MSKDWHGLVKILEIKHIDVDGTILWSAKNLRNMFHILGEQFVLEALFLGGNNPNTYVPTNYYFGLDNRSVIAAADTMTTINGLEPTTNGYARQAVASTGQFTTSLVGSIYQASSPVLSFVGTGGSWGPVKNLFLTNTDDYSGVLIGSVSLAQTLTVTTGQTVSMKMGLALQDIE